METFERTDYMEKLEVTGKVTLQEFIYYLYFGVMLFAKGVGLYEGNRLYTASFALGIILFVLKITLTKHTITEYCVILGLSALSILIYLNSNQLGIFIIVMTVLGMKNVPVDRVMKLGFAIWMLTFSASAFCALIGVKNDIFMAQSKLGLGYIIRWALGQPHPNVLQISYMMICAFVLYFTGFHGKKLYATVTALFLGALYFFMYSVSFTGMALTVIYLFLHLYLTEWRKGRSINIFEKTIVVLMLPLCILFSILGPLYFPEKLWNICNKALNTRFNIAKQYMSFNPVSLFGSGYCNELPSDLNNLDCSYVFSLMHYGIIFFVILFVAYEMLIIHLLKEDRRCELGIVLALVIAGISEPFFVNASFKNISLIFLGSFIYAGSRLSETKPLKYDFSWIPKLINQLTQSIRKHKKTIILAVVSASLLGGIVMAFTIKLPAAYYMNRSRVQIVSKGVFLDINNLPDDFDGEFLEYTDAETPMIRIDGNAIKLEFVRAVVSSAVWSGYIFFVVLVITLYMRDRRTIVS